MNAIGSLTIAIMLLWREARGRPVATVDDFARMVCEAPRPLRWVIAHALALRRLAADRAARRAQEAK